MKTPKTKTFAPFPVNANAVLATKDEGQIMRWMQKLNPYSMRIIREDPYLEPYSDAILGRYKYQLWKEHELTKESGSLSAMASGYEYFGLHHSRDGKWYFREWAPNATRIVMIGTFSDWQEKQEYELTRLGDNGIWELVLPNEKLHHLDLYKLKVYWNGGEGERIPAWADRTVQDEQTKIFSAQVWAPERPYKFRYSRFQPQVNPLMIYECHIGMATSEEKVGTYEEPPGLYGHSDYGHSGAPLLRFVRLSCFELLCRIQPLRHARRTEAPHRRCSPNGYCRDYGYCSQPCG